MKKVFLLFLVIVLAALTLTSAFADFGDYASSSDYGDWGDSSSSFDWDNDSSSSFLGGFMGGLLGSGGIGGVIGVIIIIIIFLVMRSKKKNAGNNKRPVAPGATPTAASRLNPVDTFRNRDPAFSEAVITEKISNLYVKLQNSWTAKELEPLRPYLTEEMYAKSERQIQSMIANKQTNVIERIAVLGVNLSGWYTDGNNDNLVARLHTRICDYVVDDNTGKVIRGSKDTERFMEYEWTLTRKAGMVTPVDDSLREVNCPNCSAPLNVAQSAKCPYCGSIVTNSDYDWVISQIKGISQRSGN